MHNGGGFQVENMLEYKLVFTVLYIHPSTQHEVTIILLCANPYKPTARCATKRLSLPHLWLTKIDLKRESTYFSHSSSTQGHLEDTGMGIPMSGGGNEFIWDIQDISHIGHFWGTQTCSTIQFSTLPSIMMI